MFIIAHLLLKLSNVLSDFPDVFRCFLLLLKRLGINFWQGEGHEFPQVVFDAVKDNPSYCDLLNTINGRGERPWFLAWFSEYLQTIRYLPIFGEILAKMVDFMCEEWQHERFQDARPVIMMTATQVSPHLKKLRCPSSCLQIQLLSSVLRQVRDKDMVRHSQAVTHVIDIHADIFIAVAFSRRYRDSTWSDARNSARELINNALVADVTNISNTITQLCKSLAGREMELTSPSIRKALWKKMYETIQSTDSDGVAMILSIVARAAHFDLLTKKAFRPAWQKPNVTNGAVLEAAFDAVNQSLMILRTGFLDAVSRYANSNVSLNVLELMRKPGVVKDIMALMFSPVEDIHMAAQTLVGQAFDVDVRLDCFRALLEKLPLPAFEGMFDFLETFAQYAPVVPEACSCSKSLVRCLTDVIEVLCASNGGLLHDDQFLTIHRKPNHATVSPNWWTLMTKVIAVIFRRTPSWSTYFENEDMIVWMRDALIFGRELLAQRRVIENAVQVSSGGRQTGNTKNLSAVGKQMVTDLQDVLPELARWLRLTDEELLHQSFALLESLLDCFRECNVPPSQVGLMRLSKHIDDARKNDPDRPQTYLDAARLSKLEDAIASFTEDDDEVQIISYNLASKPRRTPAETHSQIKAPTRNNNSKESALTTGRTFPGPPKVQKSEAQAKVDELSSIPSSRGLNALPTIVQPDAPKNQDLSDKKEPSSAPHSDHASSSSEESGIEDEGATTGLSSLVKLQRTPKVKKQAERRQVKMLDLPLHGQNLLRGRSNQHQDARRTALRLKPDTSELHRTVLSWNYDHEGSEPPLLADKSALIRVPDQFPDYQHYRRVFEPLLKLECWSQILQSKDEPQEQYMAKVLSRQFIDDWLDIDIMISGTVKKDWYLSETDVVLFRHANESKSRLGKVQSYKALPFGILATIRCVLRGGVGDPGLHINSLWCLSKVFRYLTTIMTCASTDCSHSLTTIHREYAALMALPYYDLFATILRPQLAEKPAIDSRDVKQTMQKYNVNEPQAVAILSALQAIGFSLIQG